MKMETEIRFVPGVGPARAKLFNKLGVFTVEDLLNYFPRDWIMPSDCKKIADAEPGKTIITTGEVVAAEYTPYTRPPRFTAIIEDETGRCTATWFNGGWVGNQLCEGKQVMLCGRAK